MPFKPDGYTSVSPYLIVRDARKTLAFMQAVFGAGRLRVMRATTAKASCTPRRRIDDSIVMMGEMPDGPDSNVHVYVADVEAAFERAKQAGGSVVQALQRKGDGDYRGGIADRNGTVWWLSQQDG